MNVLVSVAGTTLTSPSISISEATSLSAHQSATIQCAVISTRPETVTVDWSTTALSANISNQTVNTFFTVVSKVLYYLTNVTVDTVECIHAMLLMQI